MSDLPPWLSGFLKRSLGHVFVAGKVSVAIVAVIALLAYLRDPLWAFFGYMARPEAIAQGRAAADAGDKVLSDRLTRVEAAQVEAAKVAEKQAAKLDQVALGQAELLGNIKVMMRNQGLQPVPKPTLDGGP